MIGHDMQHECFKTSFARDIFKNKYSQGVNDSWEICARRIVNAVCGNDGGTKELQLLSEDEQDRLVHYITTFRFLPGGRYIYYAGRELNFYNNCFCLRVEEDSREAWGSLLQRSSDCLMSGGGIGVDYSIIRPSGRLLKRTGGVSSGPIPLMQSVNEVGRNVMQGGSRRSAIYASLNWQHEDIQDFIRIKDWDEKIKELKADDFNFPAPLDMTNISINWDTDFVESYIQRETDPAFKIQGFNSLPDLWYESVLKMCQTGEPGHSYNFWEHEDETLRNACCEFTSEDDSDVCNLGSVNFGAIDNLEELKDVVALGAKFLVCGTLRADVPYDKVAEVRKQNRKIGLGIMGVHENLLKNGEPYEVTDRLKGWLSIYKDYSESGAQEICDKFNLNYPISYRAIAPTGTIGILASTTTGIEPLYAVAYKRRYLDGGTRWRYQYVIDATAERLITEYGLDPESIETSTELAKDPVRRIKFQADIQDYVDMAVSSTLNLPEWGSKYNNEQTAKDLANTLATYCTRLRGITAYPDGARGGQPLTAVKYEDAHGKRGVIYDETEEKCAGGICGL